MARRVHIFVAGLEDAELRHQLLKIWKAEVVEISGPAGAVLSADKNGILIACGLNALRILELQREGGKRLTAEQFLAGHPLKAGKKLSSRMTKPVFSRLFFL